MENEWTTISKKKKTNSHIKTYEEYTGDYEREKGNYKRNLCKNMNKQGECMYNNKCLYAHGLNDQKIDFIRKIAYDMIRNNDDLSHIDLLKNKKLYDCLLSLTKVCEDCINGICTGGYNCKHGVCDRKYIICQTDLNKGSCDGKCGNVHLTKKGLIPYGKKITTCNENNKTINEPFDRIYDNSKIMMDSPLSSPKNPISCDFVLISEDDYNDKNNINLTLVNDANYEDTREEYLNKSIFNIDFIYLKN